MLINMFFCRTVGGELELAGRGFKHDFAWLRKGVKEDKDSFVGRETISQ